MKKTGNSLALIAFASALLLVPAGFAQQSSQAPNQGVSNPPADDTIVTSQDEPASSSAAKPSPAVSAKPAATSPVASTAPAPAANPDYGIVSSVPSASASAAPATSAALEKRPYNPDEDIVGYVPSPSNELAEGTNIRARLLEILPPRKRMRAQRSRPRLLQTSIKMDELLFLQVPSCVAAW